MGQVCKHLSVSLTPHSPPPSPHPHPCLHHPALQKRPLVSPAVCKAFLEPAPPSQPHNSTASSLSFCICWCYCPSLCGTLLQMTSSDIHSEDERDETLHPRHQEHHFHWHIHIFCSYLAAHLFFFFYVVFIVGNLILAPAGFPQGAPLTTSLQLLL